MPKPILKTTLFVLGLLIFGMSQAIAKTATERKLERAQKKLKVYTAAFTDANYAGKSKAEIAAVKAKMDAQKLVVDRLIEQLKREKGISSKDIGKKLNKNPHFIGIPRVGKSLLTREFTRVIEGMKKKKKEAKRKCKKEYKNEKVKLVRDKKVDACIAAINKEADATIKEYQAKLDSVKNGTFTTFDTNPTFNPKKQRIREADLRKTVESAGRNVTTACVVPSSSECAAARAEKKRVEAQRLRNSASYGARAADCGLKNHPGTDSQVFRDEQGKLASRLVAAPRCVGPNFSAFEFTKGGRQDHLKKIECRIALADELRKGMINAACKQSGYGNKICSSSEIKKIEREALNKIFKTPIRRPIYIYGDKPTINCGEILSV